LRGISTGDFQDALAAPPVAQNSERPEKCCAVGAGQ